MSKNSQPAIGFHVEGGGGGFQDSPSGPDPKGVGAVGGRGIAHDWNEILIFSPFDIVDLKFQIWTKNYVRRYDRVFF